MRIEITMEKQDIVKEIEKKITRLNPEQKKRLLDSIRASLKPKNKRQHSLLELEGLGKEIWEKTNTDKYLNDERKSWE